MLVPIYNVLILFEKISLIYSSQFSKFIKEGLLVELLDENHHRLGSATISGGFAPPNPDYWTCHLVSSTSSDIVRKCRNIRILNS
jgi:hypothetical protein